MRSMSWLVIRRDREREREKKGCREIRWREMMGVCLLSSGLSVSKTQTRFFECMHKVEHKGCTH